MHFRYFVQYTPNSFKISRSARLEKMLIDELDKQDGDGDYADGYLRKGYIEKVWQEGQSNFQHFWSNTVCIKIIDRFLWILPYNYYVKPNADAAGGLIVPALINFLFCFSHCFLVIRRCGHNSPPPSAKKTSRSYNG